MREAVAKPETAREPAPAARLAARRAPSRPGADPRAAARRREPRGGAHARRAGADPDDRHERQSRGAPGGARAGRLGPRPTTSTSSAPSAGSTSTPRSPATPASPRRRRRRSRTSRGPSSCASGTTSSGSPSPGAGTGAFTLRVTVTYVTSGEHVAIALHPGEGPRQSPQLVRELQRHRPRARARRTSSACSTSTSTPTCSTAPPPPRPVSSAITRSWATTTTRGVRARWRSCATASGSPGTSRPRRDAPSPPRWSDGFVTFARGRCLRERQRDIGRLSMQHVRRILIAILGARRPRGGGDGRIGGSRPRPRRPSGGAAERLFTL